MTFWSQFEKRIVSDLTMQGIFVSQIPTGCRIVSRKGFGGGGGARPSIQMVKTDFDFCAAVDGRAVFFDAKACGERTFNIRSLILREKKRHQFLRMREAHRTGAKAGYLIWFYEERLITWAPVEVVAGIIADRTSKNITPDLPGCFTQEDSWKVDIARMAGLVVPSSAVS